MPFYTFHCLKCEEVFEGYAKMEERSDERCKCGGRTEILIGSVRLETETSAAKFEAGDREWTGSPEQVRELDFQHAREKGGKVGANPKGYWHTNLAADPIYIRDRSDLKQKAGKRGIACPHQGVYGENG